MDPSQSQPDVEDDQRKYNFWDRLDLYFQRKEWQTASLGDMFNAVLHNIDSDQNDWDTVSRHEKLGPNAFKTMADATSTSPELRHLYYEHGILAAVIKRAFSQQPPPNHALMVQYLRLLGNSLDEESGDCRKAVLPHIKEMMATFADSKVAETAVGVLYNLCLDEVAEKEALKLNLDVAVARGLHNGTFPPETNAPKTQASQRALAFLDNFTCELPANLHAEDPTSTLKELLPAALALGEALDYTSYSQCIMIILRYLELADVQIALLKHPEEISSALDVLTGNMKTAYTLLNTADPSRSLIVSQILDRLDIDPTEELKAFSADPATRLRGLLGTQELIEKLVLLSQREEWRAISAEDVLRLTLKTLQNVIQRPLLRDQGGEDAACACIMLGNFLGNPNLAQMAVNDQAHRGLLQRLLPDTPRKVMQSATQCLFRLSVMPPTNSAMNKDIMGRDGALGANLAVIALKDPRVAPDAAGLLRVLLADSKANVDLLNHDPIDEVNAAWITNKEMRSTDGNEAEEANTSAESSPPTLFASLINAYKKDPELADLAIAVVEAIKQRPEPAGRYATDVVAILLKLLENEMSSYPFQRGLFAIGVLSDSRNRGSQGAPWLLHHFGQHPADMEALVKIAKVVEETEPLRSSIRENTLTIFYGLRQWIECEGQRFDLAEDQRTHLKRQIWDGGANLRSGVGGNTWPPLEITE